MLANYKKRSTTQGRVVEAGRSRRGWLTNGSTAAKMLSYLLYLTISFFRFIDLVADRTWTPNQKPGAETNGENRAAPDARSSTVELLSRRGADSSVQEQVRVARETGGAAAGPDGMERSKVLSKLTIFKMLAGGGMILTLGTASAVLGLYAEAYRSAKVFIIDGKCIYPSDVEGNYGAIAGTVLTVAQIIVTVLVCRGPEDVKFLTRTLIPSWIFCLYALYCFMAADEVRQTQELDGKCFVVKPFIYARGSFLAIIITFWHLTAYLVVCANSSAAKAHYIRIQANDDPERAYPESSSAAAILQQREVLWTKLQVLKDKYLEDMKQLYGQLTQKTSTPMSPAQRQNVQSYINVVDRLISYLMVTKERLPSTFNQDTIADFERQIVQIMGTFKRRQTPPQSPVLPGQQPLQPNHTQQLLPQQLASATVPTPAIPAIPPPPSNPVAGP